MLQVEEVRVKYGDLTVLRGVTISVNAGEVVCLLGPNGAGKSTLVNSISGLVTPESGHVKFRDRNIESIPIHERVRLGIAHVMERRRLFPNMSVEENLLLGAYSIRNGDQRRKSLSKMWKLFPILEKRHAQMAGTLSGGEQQMCAIARGLMSDPSLLILDEPLLGLAPQVMEQLLELLRSIRSEGIGILFVEQNVQLAFRISDRAYILEQGAVALEGLPEELGRDDRVRSVYLGL